MGKIKIGVIGTGHLGKFHIKMLKQIADCEVVGIFDAKPEVAKQAGEELNVKPFDSLDELLNVIDSVSIAAITGAHYELAKKCLLKGLHVFLEKPITAGIDEAEEIVKIAADKKLKLQVGHIERFNPALIFIQTDRLAQFNPRGTDVAVVLDLMIHDIDIILSLIKSEVKDIQASGVAVVSNNIDIANARIEFENGAVANVTSSRISQKRMRKMRIFQRDNYIALDFITGVSEVYRLVPLEEKVNSGYISFGEIGIDGLKKQVVYEQPEIKGINALEYELELFIKAIINDQNPVVSGMDGLRALKVAGLIVDKIKESHKAINL